MYKNTLEDRLKSFLLFVYKPSSMVVIGLIRDKEAQRGDTKILKVKIHTTQKWNSK